MHRIDKLLMSFAKKLSNMVRYSTSLTKILIPKNHPISRKQTKLKKTQQKFKLKIRDSKKRSKNHKQSIIQIQRHLKKSCQNVTLLIQKKFEMQLSLNTLSVTLGLRHLIMSIQLLAGWSNLLVDSLTSSSKHCFMS